MKLKETGSQNSSSRPGLNSDRSNSIFFAVMKKVRTRFAPSPTGPLHIGGVRTALYAYLFAKHAGGDFILRIEDTDRNRFVPGAEEYIIESLNWCGIIPDESVTAGGPFKPYRQSERKEIYDKYIKQLLNKGHAYYAFDSPTDLEIQRRAAEKEGRVFSYDASVRMKLKNSLSMTDEETSRILASGEDYVIRIKVMPGETISFDDMVRGEVSFPSESLDDKVLMKSDGMPTYHLAHLVDDIEMQVTHVIRGEEWLPSTPTHILIYQALDLADRIPRFAHLPLLLKPEGSGKLSKRDGDRLGFPVFPLQWKDPVTGEISMGFREKGYYPEAFINMLALLGWNPGTEQEIFTLNELEQLFSIQQVNKAGARFDPEKAKWFNAQWLHRKPVNQLAAALKKQVLELGWHNNRTDSYFYKAAALLQPRVHFEYEMAQAGKYLFVTPDLLDEKVLAKKWKEPYRSFFTILKDNLANQQDFRAETIELTVKKTAEHQQLKPGEIMQLMRVLVSGQSSGVDLFPMMELLGSHEVVQRIESGLLKVKG